MCSDEESNGESCGDNEDESSESGSEEEEACVLQNRCVAIYLTGRADHFLMAYVKVAYSLSSHQTKSRSKHDCVLESLP